MPAAPISIPLVNGIDTRNPPHMVAAPYLLRAQNRYFDSDIGLRKRNGYWQLPARTSDGGRIAKGTSLVAYKDELLLCDDEYLYSYSDDTGWARRSALVPTGTNLVSLVSNAYTQIACVYAATATLEVWVYIDNRDAIGAGSGYQSKIRCSVVDRQTKAVIAQDVLLVTGGVRPKFVRTSPSNWVLLYVRPGTSLYGEKGQLCGRQFLGIAASLFGPEQVIESEMGAPGAFDVIYTGTRGVVGWLQNDFARGTCIVAPLHDTGRIASVGESGVGLSRCPGDALNAIGKQTNRLSLAAGITGDVTVTFQRCLPGGTGHGSRAVFFSAQVTLGADWSIGSAPGAFDPWFEQADTLQAGIFDFDTFHPVNSLTTLVHDGAFYYAVSAVDTGGGVSTLVQGPNGPKLVLGHTVAAKAFSNGTSVYLWLINSPVTSTAQPTVLLYDVNKDAIVAMLGYGVASRQTEAWTTTSVFVDNTDVERPLPATVDIANNTYRVPLLKQVRILSFGSSQKGQFSAFGFDVRFPPAYEFGTARIGDSQVFAGGLVSSYDGASVVEHGFLSYPEVISATPVQKAGGTVAGQVEYRAVWQWVDNCGQVFQSAPSEAIPVTVTAPNNAVDLKFGSLALTRKSGVTLRIFRTSDLGVVHQEVTSPSLPLLNDPQQLSVDATDYISDDDLASNAILYTVSGELPNDPAPSSQVAWSSKNRLFLAGGDDNDVVTYSKESVKNVGTSFSLAFQRRVAALPGPITGIATMDSYVVVFKNPGIFYFSGRGPAATGINDDFTDTELLTPELGCLNHKSIVTTQEGIYFQSSKGIYLLTRGMDLIYVGAGAEGYNGQSVVSAVMMPRKNHVRFGCVEDETLVYHYRMVSPFGSSGVSAGQWTTFTNHAQRGACLWRGAYTFIRPDGSVWSENDGFTDPDGAVRSVIQTAWLKVGQPLQAGRYRELAILGQYFGPHALNIDVAQDYRAAPFASLRFNAKAGCSTSVWGAEPWGTSSWGGDADDVFDPYGPLPVQTAGLGVICLTLYDSALSDEDTLGDSASIEVISLMAEAEERLLRGGQKKQMG